VIDHPHLQRPGLEEPESVTDERLAIDEESRRKEDRLVALVGSRTVTAFDPVSDADVRFLEWWATEMRARDSGAALSSAGDRFEVRMRTVLAARRHGVALGDGETPRRPPSIEGAVAHVIVNASGHRCAPSLDLGVAAGVGRDLWDEPCTSLVELPEHVPDGQHVALTVTGESMEPLLHAGDTILVKLGVPLRRDSIVVARRPDDGYVVKRVARIGTRFVELASLHDGYAPIRIPRRDDLILGTVIMRWSARPAA